MQVPYSCIGKTLSVFSKRLMIVAGLITLPVAARLETVPNAKTAPARQPEKPVKPDPRTVRLQKFFAKLHCPVLNMSEDFVHAADDNHLDWRLLPSISVIESGGGKAYRNNNLFGWDNGDQAFPTLRAGLNLVAYKLGKSPLYRDRDVAGKLRIYNPDTTYPQKVMDVMNRISPVVDLRPAERILRRQNEYVYATD
ncbi:MAG TPA: hypothetical protein VH601_24690 [Bryobacteraceae bacterium]|jgi:hypothetical protein